MIVKIPSDLGLREFSDYCCSIINYIHSKEINIKKNAWIGARVNILPGVTIGENTIINTFLESYDFSGKTIVPFFTSGGSGVGKTNDMLHPSCDGSVIWKPAKQLNRVNRDAITEWIKNLNL